MAERIFKGLALVLAGLAMTAATPATRVPSLVPPIVIGHRGASGQRPEHTLESYDLAIDEGADFIEPDLVLTKDDVFVARHENDITGTTDVASRPEFADRKATRVIDGETHTGWFTEDFTLAELKTLRAKERLPQLRPDNARFDGQFEIPTLAEVIALAKRRSRELGRIIGIYPETKHSSYFASIGKPMEARLVAELKAAGWDGADAPVFIQSFEVANLKALARMTRIRLVQLVDAAGGPADKAAPSYAAMLTPAGLKEVRRYAWGIGANLLLVDSGSAATGLVRDAHAARLKVHVWSFRQENYFLPAPFKQGDDPRAAGDLARWIARGLADGIDGFFTDFPLIGSRTRDAFVREGK